jgi:hypothetical protein
VPDIVIPYKPRAPQQALHDAIDVARWIVAVFHRRLGKTVAGVNHLQKSACTCQRERPRFAYIAPTYRQGKAIAWDYMQHYARPIPGVVFSQSELRVDYPNGGQVRIYGADNPDSLRGIYLDGAVLDEYGMHPPGMFSEVIRPALADRQGWACFLGTPNGMNQFAEIKATAEREMAAGNTAWRYLEYRASATGIVPQDELDAAKAVMSADEYAQEWECSFAASVRGAIFAKEIEDAHRDGRVCRVPYDPAIPVDTDWDLGMGDATSIWFSQSLRSGEVRVIDYYEASGEGLPHYVYGDHWAPHDIQVREIGSGRSRLDTARSLGIRFRVCPKMGLEDGIHAARMLIPRCYFDVDKTATGLEALSSYRREYNSRLDEFKPTPVHDWASHGADAFRYLAARHKAPGSDEAVIVKPPSPSLAYGNPSLGWMD